MYDGLRKDMQWQISTSIGLAVGGPIEGAALLALDDQHYGMLKPAIRAADDTLRRSLRRDLPLKLELGLHWPQP